ncbi:conserved hypothetical protein [Candidatus Jettenia caeni]|uniref:Uncharacterized protein n=1 Tax=Candidatus Jettenia caeni TaxID=247490 RepID=I3IHY1_9BACT|nr:conserved hypothetical protein [Candidatus Jettenia caeni]
MLYHYLSKYIETLYAQSYILDVGQDFSLASPPEHVHRDSNPKGLPYRIEIPKHLK